MNTNGDISDNPTEWAKRKYKADPAYWQDRSRNGSGLIKEIADFVIQQAATK